MDKSDEPNEFIAINMIYLLLFVYCIMVNSEPSSGRRTKSIENGKLSFCFACTQSKRSVMGECITKHPTLTNGFRGDD
ncbi:hypothetical protein T10_10356 [Trichinella papuae]|uniref:Uncharacterized protein n=1 Tax=Trichinella papuae TaxID=268474 RepID=A0A0V1MR91_9BILA|nr:hypothetical protein T10_10356 [Trichinella papuae]